MQYYDTELPGCRVSGDIKGRHFCQLPVSCLTLCQGRCVCYIPESGGPPQTAQSAGGPWPLSGGVGRQRGLTLESPPPLPHSPLSYHHLFFNLSNRPCSLSFSTARLTAFLQIKGGTDKIDWSEQRMDGQTRQDGWGDHSQKEDRGGKEGGKGSEKGKAKGLVGNDAP